MITRRNEKGEEREMEVLPEMVVVMGVPEVVLGLVIGTKRDGERKSVVMAVVWW